MKQEVKDMQEKYRIFTVELHNYSNEELAELFQSTQAEECLVELMQKNKGIIYTIASSYKISGYDMEDLMAVGYEALWRAADNFDNSKGYTFSNWIKVHLRQALNRLYTEAKRKKRWNGSEPTSFEELAEINRERATYDDYSGLELREFIESLSGTAKAVAQMFLDGYTNGGVAEALSITPASVSYHCKRIKAAYLAYCVEG